MNGKKIAMIGMVAASALVTGVSVIGMIRRHNTLKIARNDLVTNYNNYLSMLQGKYNMDVTPITDEDVKSRNPDPIMVKNIMKICDNFDRFSSLDRVDIYMDVIIEFITIYPTAISYEKIMEMGALMGTSDDEQTIDTQRNDTPTLGNDETSQETKSVESTEETEEDDSGLDHEETIDETESQK